MRAISLIISFCLIQVIQAKNINILDLGADPNGETLCTDLIQKGIDDCSASGGGKVIVPTGVFLTGTIFLKSNVNLYLENGAVLLGSKKIEDYNNKGGVIRALKANNIGLTGNGSVDGQGFAFWTYRNGRTYSHKSPSTGNLIEFEACKNVIIENVTLRGSESWTLHLLACEEVLVTGIKIRNPLHGPNTDGIDINMCGNVMISNCDIYTSDDAIVLKSRHPDYYGKVCENITVTNCILTAISNGFKIGTETMSDFRNIVFSNSVIKAAKAGDELAKVTAAYVDSNRLGSEYLGLTSGISLESVDGSNLQGVTITNIVMDGARVPIFIRLANRGRYAEIKKVAVPVPGTLKDVVISNVIVYNATISSSISSIPGSYVENVMLNNIMIRTKGGGNKESAEKKLDEKINSYPEGTMWGTMPVSGFYVRHVKGLQMSDITIIVGENDMRPLIKFDDITELYINNLQTNEVHKGDCILDFNNAKKVSLLNIDFPETMIIPWLFFKGKETENVIIRTIDIKKNSRYIKTDNLVIADEIKVF
jgi:polygalacturonase